MNFKIKFFITILLLFSVMLFAQEAPIVQMNVRTGVVFPMLFVNDNNFIDKTGVQSGMNFNFGLGATFIENYWLNLDFNVSPFANSKIVNGFYYKGFTSLGLNLNFGARFSVYNKENLKLFLGARVGGGFDYGFYNQAKGVFIIPKFKGDLLFDISKKDIKFFDFRVFIPLEYQFRKDLKFSLKTGVGLDLIFKNFLYLKPQ